MHRTAQGLPEFESCSVGFRRYLHSVSSPKCGPFWGPAYKAAPLVSGTQKGTVVQRTHHSCYLLTVCPFASRHGIESQAVPVLSGQQTTRLAQSIHVSSCRFSFSWFGIPGCCDLRCLAGLPAQAVGSEAAVHATDASSDVVDGRGLGQS